MTGRHATLGFRRAYPVPPARLWQAWTDPAARAAWAAPTPQVTVEFVAADTRPGGREVSICRAPGMADIRCELGWLVLDRDRLAINTELLTQDACRLSAALVTAEIVADGADGTQLALTVQLASLDRDMAGDYRDGFGAALDTIAAHLAG